MRAIRVSEQNAWQCFRNTGTVVGPCQSGAWSTPMLLLLVVVVLMVQMSWNASSGLRVTAARGDEGDSGVWGNIGMGIEILVVRASITRCCCCCRLRCRQLHAGAVALLSACMLVFGCYCYCRRCFKRWTSKVLGWRSGLQIRTYDSQLSLRC